MKPLVCMLVLLNVLATSAFAQRFGVAFEDHHDPYGGRVTEVTNGYPAQQVQSDEDGGQYRLIGGLHVITEINGVRVGSAAECKKAVVASPSRISFRVFNLESRTHRLYHAVLLGESRGELDLGRSLKWEAGQQSSQFKNVVAAAEEDQWAPLPGYDWVRRKTFGPVKWVPGSTHPDYHIVAAMKEGEWALAPGHVWMSNSNNDLRTKWGPGTPHPNHYVVASNGHGNWRPESGYAWVSNDPDDLRVVEATSDDDSDYAARENTGSESFDLDLKAIYTSARAQAVMLQHNNRYYRYR